jgi:ankyrin repeat protein
MAASSADSEEAVAKVDVLLADGADIHITSSSGQNLCHIAAIQRNTTLLEKVLLARVSHMKRDVEGNTPLHYACAVADNNMVIMILVDAGVDVNETNYAGVSPLYHALASQHVSNITPLIKTGVSFEKSNLETGLYRDLQMLAQPEIIMASSRPLEFALCLSSFYEQMANKKPRLKEGYMELSLEMENVAISVVGGLQLKQMQRLALNGPVIENAIVTQRKRVRI